MTTRSHLVICGFSGIGVRIVEQLIASGESVALVVRSMTPELDAALRAWQIEVHTAVVGVDDALEKAGIGTAAAVLCIDDDELWNLEASLAAAQRRPDVRVITQMANTTVRGALDDDDLPGVTLDIAELAAPAVIEACVGVQEHHLEIEGTDFVAAQLSVPSSSTLRDLYGDLAPVAVTADHDRPHAQVLACPGRDLRVEQGDIATMFGTRISSRTITFASTPPRPRSRTARQRHRGRCAGSSTRCRRSSRT